MTLGSPCSCPGSLNSFCKVRFHLQLAFSLLKEQHVSRKTFFDKPVTRIIRHITNNEEQSDSKYILSTASPPPVPCKCHLWNICLFVVKHKTFSSVLFHGGWERSPSLYSTVVSHSQIKVLKAFIFKARTAPIKAQNISF